MHINFMVFLFVKCTVKWNTHVLFNRGFAWCGTYLHMHYQCLLHGFLFVQSGKGKKKKQQSMVLIWIYFLQDFEFHLSVCAIFIVTQL